jgi:hypothetical protein
MTDERAGPPSAPRAASPLRPTPARPLQAARCPAGARAATAPGWWASRRARCRTAVAPPRRRPCRPRAHGGTSPPRRSGRGRAAARASPPRAGGRAEAGPTARGRRERRSDGRRYRCSASRAAGRAALSRSRGRPPRTARPFPAADRQAGGGIEAGAPGGPRCCGATARGSRANRRPIRGTSRSTPCACARSESPGGERSRRLRRGALASPTASALGVAAPLDSCREFAAATPPQWPPRPCVDRPRRSTVPCRGCAQRPGRRRRTGSARSNA